MAKTQDSNKDITEKGISKALMRKSLLKLKKEYTNGGTKALNRELNRIDYGSLTLQEIAFIFDITRERVRQIETKALKKLSHPLIGRHLKRYIHEYLRGESNGRDVSSYECQREWSKSGIITANL